MSQTEPGQNFHQCLYEPCHFFSQKQIDEFTDVNEGEKEVMKLWNLHVMKHGQVLFLFIHLLLSWMEGLAVTQKVAVQPVKSLLSPVRATPHQTYFLYPSNSFSLAHAH